MKDNGYKYSYMDKVGSFFTLITGRIKDKATDKSWSGKDYQRLLRDLRDWIDERIR